MKRSVFFIAGHICILAVILISSGKVFAQEKADDSSWGKPLFDGKTFEGWEFRNEANAKVFRIEDGAIVGGSMKEPIPLTEYIVTAKKYGDFTLRLQAKCIGTTANGGVQIRSFRQPKDSQSPHEMIGYQADMTSTDQYWGSLYEGGRRKSWFVAEADAELVKSIFRPNDWNDVEIVCKGDNIKILLNGKLTVDYTEKDADIPRKGFISLQVHNAGPHECWYRNIHILEE